MELTEREAFLLSARTGYLFLPFDKFHALFEKELARPVLTHEFAFQPLSDEIFEKIEDDYQNMINNMRVIPNGEKTYVESLLEDLKSEIKICDKNIESVEDPSWANGYAVVSHWRSRKELAKELYRQIENHYLKGDV